MDGEVAAPNAHVGSGAATGCGRFLGAPVVMAAHLLSLDSAAFESS